jgi:hypothetical protein
MGLKRRNPARTRLLSAPEVLAAAATPKAPAKAAEVKPGVAKAAAPPAPPATPQASTTPPVNREERYQRIQKLAYIHAERSGFRADPVQSWLHAEREVDAELSRKAS